MDNSIVPAHLAVKAMRDNGYKNAAYAIAELMDNSIQHGATVVELLCSEIDVPINSRTVSRINQIGILDNGTGMNSETLRMALQFGNGTHLNSENQKGIGKFGMGLPSSSISQAKTVEVWTWQNGIENAIYSYLDIDKILRQELKEVPQPEKKEIPAIWRKAGKSFDNTGTLVVWSNIDRCIWKTAQAIIDNSELLIGRMYRKFLQNGKVKIKMVTFKEANPSNLTSIKMASSNDPIYLMDKTSCPAPFNDDAMFTKWGGDEGFEVVYKIPYMGQSHDVKVRFSIAKEDARKGYNPGSKPHGKHAGKNIGVSVVRAERELDLDQAWVIQYDSRERWWGVEIEFQPALDEIFGVTNNKQFANNFSELGKMDITELLTEKTLHQLKEELEEEGDPKSFLVELAQRIDTNIYTMRRQLKAQASTLEKEDKTRHQNIEDTPEKKATEATEERKEDGHTGTSDKQEEKTVEERKKDVEKALDDDGIPNAEEIVKSVFENNLKYQFVESDFDGPAFFSVKSRGGKILIALNTNHPAYQKLIEVLEKSTDGEKQDELQNRLQNASEGLKLLLMAWARYEDEQPDGTKKNNVQDSRTDWGRIARDFLKED